MKIYLDDVRPLPDDTWTPVRWPQEVIDLLMTQRVDVISLDHDLGEEGQNARTGYDVLPWIEEQVVVNGFVPPVIHVHSDNSAGIQRMVDAVEAIKTRTKANRTQGREWNGSFDLPPPYR